MRQSDLLKTVSSYVAELDNIDRFVKIDDNHIAVLDVVLFKHPRRRRDEDILEPHARVSVFERELDDNDKVTDDWSCIDLGEADSRLLGRVAELTAMCEKWNRNEADDLPPSTADDPRGKRRVYRRLMRH